MNWATINPDQCAAHQLVEASPPLMTPDHVHFTPAGYVKGADLFLDALIPVIEKLQVRPNIAAKRPPPSPPPTPPPATIDRNAAEALPARL